MSRSTHTSDPESSTQQTPPDETPPEPSNSTQPSRELDAHTYECPFCDATYSHEYFTRAHVTICDDEAHLNQNGLMPEVSINVVATDGSHLETRSREVRTAELATVTRADVPDSYTTKQTTAVVAATRSPHYDSKRELTHHIASDRDDSDLVPGERTVGRAINDFFLKPMTESSQSPPHQASTHQLTEITPLKQAIVLAQVVSPELTDLETGEKLGCSDTHVWNVRNEHHDLIQTLNSRVENGEAIEDIAATQLSAANIEEIQTEAYLNTVQFDVTALEEGSADETESTPSVESATADVERGLPAEADVMSASPDSPLSSAGAETDTDQRRLTDTPNDKTADTPAVPPEAPSTEDGVDDGNSTADAVSAPEQQPPSNTTPEPDTETKSLDASLNELHYASQVARGMMESASPDADLRSQAETFAAQVEQKCAEVQRLHNSTE